jgi:putative tricarboxylic transport membrane protein
MDPFLTALQFAFSPDALLAVFGGTFIGLVFGSIPGLTFTVALALVLPLTFAMQPTPAIALLLGTYIGGMTGGSVSAILLGIPGTPSAAATVLDGYPMTRNGRASLALGTAVLVSAFGGLFSLIIMMISVDFVAAMAIKFGPAEIFALVLFGFSTICGLAEKSLLRGLIAGVLGLMAMTIGLDPLDGAQRFTFGSTTMLQGVNLLVAMIGLFAVPHVIEVFWNYREGESKQVRAASVKAEMPSIKELKENFWLMMRCAGLGTGIGAIPGTGGPIAAFLAYDHARRFSKKPSRFGKGALEGVVAPETANNAVTGGTMIPLLSLGIPGDPATAIVLSGLLIHGLVPGPMLFVEHPVQIYAIYIAIVLAYIAVLVIQFFGIRMFVHVLRIPAHLLAVGIVVMCGIGAFAIRNSVFDVYTMGIVGLLGYIMLRAGIPTTPVILGLVLGPTLEREYRTAMILSEGKFDIFYTSPTALLFFGLAFLIVAMQGVSNLKPKGGKDTLKENRNA